MSHLFGVGLDIEVNRICCQLKMQIVKRKGIGMRALALHMGRADLYYKREMYVEEFTSALAGFNLFPSKVELQALVRAFDSGNGMVSYEKFVDRMRDPLDARRAAIVQACWNKVDEKGAGAISVPELIAAYDVSLNQDFLDGTMTKEEIVDQFIQGFFIGQEPVYEISLSMWNDYYKDLSMTIVDTGYFVGMLEAIWQVGEDATATVSKTDLEQLTRTIRHKLLDLSTDKSDEYVLRNVFREFDTDKSGNLSACEFDAMLTKLQIRAPAAYLQALLKKFDRNGNGVVEFEELVHFVTANPYK